MIKNRRQYAITKTQIKKFKAALEMINKKVSPRLLKAQEDSIKSQIEELGKETLNYEKLQHCKVIKVESIDAMPLAMIQARNALGVSQKELADRLNIKPQQIQRYEDTNYASASFSRIKKILHALNIDVKEDFILPHKTS